MKSQLAALYLTATAFVGVAVGDDYSAQVLSDGPVVFYRFEEPDAGDVPDLFATIFHLLGIGHKRLTYEVHGTVEDVTDSKANKARVVSELLA